MENKMSFFDRFGMVAQKMGNQIHLRTLRDAFATFMPFMMLAGFVTLFNYVIFDPAGFLSSVISSGILEKIQSIGTPIASATLSITSLLIVAAISYHMCQNRNYENTIAAILVSISSLMVLTPMMTTFTPEGAKNALEIPNVIPLDYIGASGMFVGIFVGLIATELFIKLSKNKKLQINLSGNIPPAVMKSFNVMIPIMITIVSISIVGFLVKELFHSDVNTLITTLVTAPLSKVTTGLPGFLLITSVANLFFGFGIHQAVISGSLLDPFLIQNMQENMAAYANHEEIPHIINMAFKDTFAVMGGSGNTIALLIAIFIFSRRQDYKDFAKLSVTPAVFNISEPIIFGLPIVFNISLIIPFILAPIFSLTIAYFATAMGFINHVVVQIPWTTPPVISGFLATAGDWRAAFLQIIIIAVSVFIYLPFLRIDEKVTATKQ
ncbi:PTS sugar transporter subunit IIC [Carnobacterium maltaromaticum]|jgi:PTS system cellobiose-specific IIC component|uniref:Permease IIC component n=1 Tax=Carnobacterium maltaromaticum LMA28 TaxID=1234679 RepID=K8EMB7_CARML|nr:PTS sugar transporter subunit IIC [Carnobacterium maltaromaticum]AOA03585.1 PTS cellobiose transporter subunit IIC [Carnobacterium maltaromaticum]KRN59796.1 oligo-beta-mannoside permease IIC component [Carnobacterium maltaromaticum DSM 20342]KRN73121.1 oligo-beta-mannoside permease IIC component [Carnobacterium maltaromaticum]MBC9809291.1 PTS sugar transporter subunit IIC [Carnobacterium maltaromaticum]MCI1818193.1 PTS sugar transporter subunit IIC [Carnobacterium maltaromaticum]